MSVRIVTTLHEDGYNLYGNNLNSWTKHFPIGWQIDYYAESHSPVLPDRITVKDFNKECEEWNDFYEYILNITRSINDNKKINWYKKALRWSFKMFTTLDALQKSKEKYVIWLDADVIVKHPPSKDWLDYALQNKCFAGKMEYIKQTPHIESGILVFDRETPQIETVCNWIEQGYINKEILNEPKPWDGFWLAKLALSKTVSWNNVNLFSPNSFLKHCVGDDKFSNQYSGRSGRTKNNELI